MRLISFSFQAMLGQKYGERPVPQLILSEIYDLIQRTLYNSKGRRSRSVVLMDKWYRQDENSIPSVHVLIQPTSQSTQVLG